MTILGRIPAGLALVVLACSNPVASPDEPAAPTAAETAEAILPPMASEPGPPARIEGLGDLHHPVTASPEAQGWFDQGLILTYGFNHEEAVKSFREGARVDPSCAMCWWGVALALGPNINLPMGPEAGARALEAVREAVRLAPGVSPREQALIAALAKRYGGPDADRAALDRAYADAMVEVQRRYPDDLDVATLTAEALMDLSPWNYWTPEGAPGPRTDEIVSLLEGVMAVDPDHPGATHYYIHAVEASETPERAEPAADRLAALGLSAGHLVHMPSHIYFRVGRYEDALEINRRAAAADELYFAWCGSQGIYRAAYYPHNVHFLWSAANAEGRSQIALSSARKLAAGVDDELVAAWPIVEEYRGIPVATYLRFGRWDAMLGEPAPPAHLRYVTGLWHYGRALAFARTGRPAEADAEAAALDAVAAEPALAQLVFPGGSAATLLRLASLHLAGERAALAGDPETAVARLEEAVAVQDGLPYTEPPPFYMPVRQALGAVLLGAGRPADAEAVYRADLEVHPKNGWSLFGLAQSLRAQGQEAPAAAAETGFAHAFARADVTLDSSRF